MACISQPNVHEVVAEEEESIQALARTLPEGDALPDGFSDCFTEAPGNDVSAIDPPIELSASQEGGIPFEDGDGVLKTETESSVILENSPEELTDRFGLTSSPAAREAYARELPKEDILPDEYSERLTRASLNDDSVIDIPKGSFTDNDDGVSSEEHDGFSEMKTESSRVLDTLPEEFPDTYGVASSFTGSQALARKLPEGDALPDGFSECFTETSDQDDPDIDLSKESSTLNDDEVSSKMKNESSKILNTSLEEVLDTDGVTNSLSGNQLLARKLPGGDVLPAGFSESFTEPSNDVSAIDFSKESSTPQEGAVSFEKGDSGLDLTIESSRTLGTLPEKFQDAYGVTSSLSAGHKFSSESSDKVVELNDGSPCSSPSERNHDRRGKLRRFPVQLSEKDSLHHSHESVGCKVDHWSENHVSSSERACSDNDFAPWSDAHKKLFANLHTTSLSGTDVPDSQAPQGMDYKRCADNHGDCLGEERTRTVKKAEAEIKNAMSLEEPSSCEAVLPMEQGALAKDNDVEASGRVHVALLKDEIVSVRHQKEQLNNDLSSTRADLAKSLLIREKLESLCRELQRQNKQLSEECKRIASEEQQKRLDLSIGFHAAIKDVTIKLEEQGDERVHQIKENEMLQEKLRHFTQQLEFREQQYAQQLRTKSLEQQVLELKLKQQEELCKQGESKIQVYTEQMAQLLKTEQDLRGRLALYGDKFQQFQDTLTKSNEVYVSFKIEMEKMSKTIKKLEKENLSLKKKCEKSDVSIIELVDERTLFKKQLETARNQKEKLEALCRILQAERKQQNVAMASVAASAAAIGGASVAATLKSEQD